MPKFKDITGQKFGRLTALYKLHNNHKEKNYYLCVCDCGNLKEIRGTSLTSGDTKSCGCLRKEKITKHGLYNTRLHSIWNSMINRCYNKNRKSYLNYGERGITMCEEWRKDFMVFYDWAMNNGYKDNLTIDRIDIDGDYEPDNCRWVDYKTQARNKTNNRYYTIDGETHCLMEWCEMLNISYSKVIKRLDICNWSIEKALELRIK